VKASEQYNHYSVHQPGADGDGLSTSLLDADKAQFQSGNVNSQLLVESVSGMEGEEGVPHHHPHHKHRHHHRPSNSGATAVYATTEASEGEAEKKSRFEMLKRRLARTKALERSEGWDT